MDLETEFPVAQDDLENLILFLPTSQCWITSNGPPGPASKQSFFSGGKDVFKNLVFFFFFLWLFCFVCFFFLRGSGLVAAQTGPKRLGSSKFPLLAF